MVTKDKFRRFGRQSKCYIGETHPRISVYIYIYEDKRRDYFLTKIYDKIYLFNSNNTYIICQNKYEGPRRRVYIMIFT